MLKKSLRFEAGTEFAHAELFVGFIGKLTKAFCEKT
jgi:hypothetical protein